ncbi:protein kinase [Streptomyces sp. PCS3-D2]|uniref:Stk1 family PASTA domain-containing Ser/Thr kinase n=1 Tax=Streptomyces sp. PCS3-D2 TaxID=1460244 RepID=UPI00044F47CE|nr:Stk1 family PASTA domain-containing Ser/Thr kinase [Streptomyces sp. PCS3-D2]WKV72970.1 protein kinase [Streptomyces sp. PCS3-D2]
MSQDGTQGQYAGGSLAGGRYQLRDLLGAGGMASVYLAYDSALDRQVAIKTLHSDLGREQSFRERFRREAQAVAKLSHTNIVSVFDTGEGEVTFGGGRPDDGAVMPYIVMEYVEGKPLGSVLDADIRQYGAMPAEKALKVTADVLAALETSHEMGLVHRDIKPGNVMVNKRGVVKVMDFGIARAMQSGVTSMTQTGMVVGTPQYLSPEQALGRGVDARSDLYSVGIMLFQLLTGRLPFDADSPLAIAYAHVQEEPVAPSSINRSVTPAMDALVARALKKNPNERFPTAAAMGDEVARVLGSGQTGAPVIVPGQGPLSSGAGVSSAVFPPVESGFQAPPQSVQQPYQAPHAPTPAPHAPTPAPYAPTPAPQPHAQGGYAYPHAAPPQQGYAPQTPPPYTISPAGGAGASGSGGGGKRNTPVVVGAIAVAVLAVGGLIAAISMNGDDKGGTTADPGSSASASAKAGYKGPDVTRTIDPKKCSEPTKHYSEAGKYQAPDLKYKNVLSVKACIQASGGKYTIVEKDEAVYGKDTVLSQSPAAGDKIDKEGTEYTLTVSTGNPE